ncbi:uncharacterized protein cd28 [Myripristis murdjan]|uniref:uncharacterized protein cd28 n=1 Tax=Myripristis murdjan TaxID=586833 RepID=UPI0011762E65|nr:uncharacterized protein LOC115379499 [Myripristis murdjan]
MMWSVLVFLCLCLPVHSDVKVVQPYRVESRNGTARLQCLIQPQPAFPEPHSSSSNQIQPRPSYPHPVPDELRVTLLKGLHGSQELCSSFLVLSQQREGNAEEGEVQCQAEVTGGAVQLTVSGLKANHTDLYRCAVEVFYPPPYLNLIGNGTLIHVQDSPPCPVLDAQPRSSQLAGDDEDEEEDEGRGRVAEAVSVPVVVLVTAVLLVLFIIVHLQAVQCRQQRQRLSSTMSILQPAPHKMDACGSFA